jgi:purine-nucleoside phosphorylase
MVAPSSRPLTAALDDVAHAVLARSGERPRVAFMLGTGPGPFSEHITSRVTIAPSELPGELRFAGDTPLVCGRMQGVPVVLSGPGHAYCEGAHAAALAFPVRVLRRLGCEVLVLTAGAASLVDTVRPGDLAVLEDHLDLSATHVLRAPPDPALGPRFLDQSEPYSASLRRLAHQAARATGTSCGDAVFAAIPGPTLPTRAEARLLQAAGATLVGMSLVPDAIVGRHAGFEVLAIAAVTQSLAAPASIPDMLAAGERALPALHALLLEVCRDLAPRTA